MEYDYQSWGDEMGIQYANVEKQDWFPFYNQWRGQPTSSYPYVRANVAGYYPYPKTERKMVPRPEPVWELAWNYGSTVFPSNPQFQANRTIILER